MNAVIYSNSKDIKTAQIKKLLMGNNIFYTEAVIGRDLVTEDVRSLYPAYSDRTVVAIDGVFVGGLIEVKQWIENRPAFLAG